MIRVLYIFAHGVEGGGGGRRWFLVLPQPPPFVEPGERELEPPQNRQLWIAPHLRPALELGHLSRTRRVWYGGGGEGGAGCGDCYGNKGSS